MNNIENWKDIDGYDGDYQVSNIGRVKSLKKVKEVILKANINQEGYSSFVGVSFRKDNKKWISQIFINGKLNRFGNFLTETEAARAYDNALIELGLAPINFPHN
ncbi:hypothetical protein FVR03_16800 [Pontibacter qinzhouensis]|uniref:AP2/ERF domain-containing protein n=1 Tax=Pontibacter qinzhouensis TaxID=2603253 RepID=A0A5C8JHF1_9BACT|nr:NUMOD4 domain-containing protein [Pontibacter qinzhouensis]TXK36801.1 hypothetical protein FVR03_16800 [Pontibacter qinzhouensis]